MIKQANVLAFLLLPAYLETSFNNSNVTKQNIVDSFCLFVETNETDTTETIDQKIKKKIETVVKALQIFQINLISVPLTIMVGSLENVQASYVLLNDYKYKFSDPMEAIEYSFKLYKTLHLEFPIINKHVWSFIQKRIFQITLNRGVAVVNALIKKLPPVESIYKIQVKKNILK